jgi:hypothetical protein
MRTGPSRRAMHRQVPAGSVAEMSKGNSRATNEEMVQPSVRQRAEKRVGFVGAKKGQQLSFQTQNSSQWARRLREAPEKKALLASPRSGGVRADLWASRRPARSASRVRRAAQNNARPPAPPAGAGARPIQPRSIWPARFRTFSRCSE